MRLTGTPHRLAVTIWLGSFTLGEDAVTRENPMSAPHYQNPY
jgi:hypothetical protein